MNSEVLVTALVVAFLQFVGFALLAHGCSFFHVDNFTRKPARCVSHEPCSDRAETAQNRRGRARGYLKEVPNRVFACRRCVF